jgi:FG-GAP repeat
VRPSALAVTVVAAACLFAVPSSRPAAATGCVGLPGDFTGDARADLAIGEAGSGRTSFPGAVRVLYNSPAGLGGGPVASAFFTDRTAGLPPAPAPAERFGFSVADGFFNGDCYADLAIGTLSDGIVVLYGSAAGLTTSRSQRFAAGDVAPAGTTGAYFGYGLAAGDFTGDGRDDLAVGAPNAAAGRGAVAVLPGTANGLTATGAQWVTGGAPGGWFGSALAAADLTGDGTADLAVGAPDSEVAGLPGAGTVTVLCGSTAGLVAGAPISQNTAGVPGAAGARDAFGGALAAADVTGDGRADLAVGSARETVGGRAGAGSVTLLPGTASGPAGTGAQLWTQDTAGVPDAAEVNDEFGTALAFGDLNRDGRPDLAVGARGESIGPRLYAGSVTTLFATAGGLAATGAAAWHKDSPGVPGDAGGDEFFGASLQVVAGRSHGAESLAVGAPEIVLAEDETQAGAVVVLPASPAGLTGAGSRLWTSNMLAGGFVLGGHLGGDLS